MRVSDVLYQFHKNPRWDRIVKISILLVCVSPVLVLAWYSTAALKRSLTQLALDRRSSLADIASIALKERLDRLIDLGHSLSTRVEFRRLVRQQKWAEAIRIMESVPPDYPFIERVFLADLNGVLTADTPFHEGVRGVEFSHRDWYRGVTTSWKPYISQVYQRSAQPRYKVVSAAFPIKDPADKMPLGILVLQVKLDTLQNWANEIRVGPKGAVAFVDQTGAVAGHPHIPPQNAIVHIATNPAVRQALAGKSGVGVFHNPVRGFDDVSAFAPVKPYGWAALVQQPVTEAFKERDRLLRIAYLIHVGIIFLAVLLAYLLVRLISQDQDLRGQLEKRVVETSNELKVETAERQKYEAQFLQAQKMEAVGRLAGGIAHDFNNLLSVILSDCELILLDAKDPNVRNDVIEIKDAAARAANLTRQLLLFSRKKMAEQLALDLNNLLAEMEPLLKRSLGEDIELKINRRPLAEKFKGNQSQIEQIILNMVINARDAMTDGGVLRLETGEARLTDHYVDSHFDVQPGHYVTLTISDTGKGMNEETKAHIFEPFFTTKGPDKGTGLGLSTVHGILKQMGGHVSVYSEEDKGSTFRLYFPVLDKAEADTAKETPPSTEYKGSETILLVEDDDSLRGVVKRILSAQGYTILEGRNGREAVSIGATNKNDVNLLMTDLVMPTMSGDQLAESIAGHIPGIKILFMSGYAESATLDRLHKKDNFNFLEKPFTPEKLTRKVREVLDH